MRLLNKIAVGASAFAFAAALTAGVVASPAPVAKAEEAPATSAPATVAANVSIDLENQQLLIKNDDKDQQISVSFPTVKKGSTEITGEKNVCTYDVVENEVTADLSTLNPTKDNYVKVWGNKNNEPIIIKIPAAETLDKAKVEFDATGKATAKVCKKGSSEEYKDGVVEFAIGTGAWFVAEGKDSKPTAVFDANDYTALGATVRARISGIVKIDDENGNEVALNEGDKKYYDNSKQYSLKKDSTTKYAAYELKVSFPSKEIKIKVPKKAAAPKVTVDYKLGTLKLPKNAEYRVNTVNQETKALTLGSSWTAGDKKTFTTSNAEGSEFNIKNAGSIDVRIKATEKKPASMYLAFRYDAQAVLNVSKPSTETDFSGSVTNPGAAECNSTKAEVGLKPAASASFVADLTAAYTRTAATYKNNDGKTVKAATSGAITLTDANKTYTYDCVLMKGSEVPKADTKKGVKSVKNGKDVTIKVKNDDDYTLYARRAAVKGGTDWATEWVPVITFTKSDLAPTVKVTPGASA